MKLLYLVTEDYWDYCNFFSNFFLSEFSFSYKIQEIVLTVLPNGQYFGIFRSITNKYTFTKKVHSLRVGNILHNFHLLIPTEACLHFKLFKLLYLETFAFPEDTKKKSKQETLETSTLSLKWYIIRFGKQIEDSTINSIFQLVPVLILAVI